MISKEGLSLQLFGLLDAKRALEGGKGAAFQKGVA